MLRCLAHTFTRTTALPRGSPFRPVRMATSVQPIVPKTVAFGPYRISTDDVFAHTALSVAFVNLKPAVPDLTTEEVADLWLLAKRVAACVERVFKADALNLAIQDGPAAGQTVPHVHIHCLPRHNLDLEKNDLIYDMIDSSEAEASTAYQARKEKVDFDKERVVRTPAEMAEEAAMMRMAMASHP